MIRGLDYAEFSTVTDINRMVTEQEQVDFVYIRARNGFKDDAKYKEHEKQIAKAVNKEGAVLWGPYMYLNYLPGVPEGDDQAADTYSLTTASGRLWQLPIAIDAERSASGPLPAVQYYFDILLIPAIKTLMDKMGRPPVFYSNPDFILNYARPLLAQPKYGDILKQCPLWIANYSLTGSPPYWPNIKALGLWTTWLAWQHKPSAPDWPGISNADLNRGAGTRAMWKAWINDASKLPVEGGAEPPPPPPPPPVEPPAGDLATLRLEFEQARARIDKIETWIEKPL